MSLTISVKPFDWRQLTSPREDGPPDDLPEWECDTIMGVYGVSFDGDPDVENYPFCAWSPLETFGHYATPEEARTACWDDFRKRVLSVVEMDA